MQGQNHVLPSSATGPARSARRRRKGRRGGRRRCSRWPGQDPAGPGRTPLACGCRRGADGSPGGYLRRRESSAQPPGARGGWGAADVLRSRAGRRSFWRSSGGAAVAVPGSGRLNPRLRWQPRSSPGRLHPAPRTQPRCHDNRATCARVSASRACACAREQASGSGGACACARGLASLPDRSCACARGQASVPGRACSCACARARARIPELLR